MRKLLLLLIVSGVLLAASAGSASAATKAERYMSNGSGGEVNTTFPNTTQGQADALAWIRGKAKGRFGVNGSIQWVVLKDIKIVHTNQNNWRGPAPGRLYNQLDNLWYSGSIQYTLNLLPNYTDLVEDSIYGPGTTSVVRTFQSRNGSAVDGVTGTNTYNVMSFTSY